MRDASAPELAPWLGRCLRLCRQIEQQLTARYAAVGLNPTRVAVLEALVSAATPPTQAALAADLNLSESSLCSLIDRMRQDGLLACNRDLRDRRKLTIAVTPLGLQQRAAADRALHQLLHCLEGEFPSGQQSQLCVLLQRVLQLMEPTLQSAEAVRRSA